MSGLSLSIKNKGRHIVNGGRWLAGILVPAFVLLGAGCSGQGGADVATLETSSSSDTASVEYVNEETAQYAECLEGLGFTVAPVPTGAAGREGLEGYAEIDGAANLVRDGGLVVGSDEPIGVDGEDRDADIRGCHAKHPGAKDLIINQADYDPPPLEPVAQAGSERFKRAVQWADCARDAGVPEVSDPPSSGVYEGYVIIPESVTLDQVETLGERCSRPAAIDVVDEKVNSTPQFSFEHKGDVDPYFFAVERPFIEIDECRHISGDECIEKLGW